MLFSIATPFIKRPVLTTVCSVIIVLVGLISITTLPISKLPQIAPIQVQVASINNGADAQTTEQTVTSIIERQINGVENMKYMLSNTNNSGVSNISVAFATDVDKNIAQVNVQNRVSQAEPQLPDVVKQTGVTTKLASPNILKVISFYSEKDKNGKYIYDTLFLSNYIDLYVTDEITRIKGVGQTAISGERKYAMRFWVDPDKLASRGLTSSDVVNALREQNIQVGAGTIGQQPVGNQQQFEIPLRASGRFTNVSEAEELILKVGQGGSLVRVKDVARVELGAENYSNNSLFNGEPAVSLLTYQLPGSNALDTARAIDEKLEDLSEAFPPGLKIAIAFDISSFVEVALADVVKTLIEAIVLVILVIFIFLQDWRTTIIPAIAIPVSLIGAMIFIKALGFELNQLTLFGLVLATGLVVDDGIVIVEAVATKMEEGMRPLQASLDAMEELTGAVISTSVVLLAVFIPVAFFPGTTGIVYQQFALTIAFSILISTFNALSFSPSLSAILLQPKQGEGRGPLAWFFRKFNQFFDWFTDKYRRLIEFFTQIKLLVMGVFIAGLVATWWILTVVPSGFIPEEDQGYFIVIGQAPPGVSLNYTTEQSLKINDILKEVKGVQSVLALPGFGFSGNGSDKVTFFVVLTPWEERVGQAESVFGLIREVTPKLRQLTGIQAFAVNAPPVDGLSNFGGVEMQLQNRQQLPMPDFIQFQQRYLAAARKRPELGSVFTQFTANTPQIQVEINRNQAKAQNIDINQIFGALQTFLGSNYVNDFVFGQRQYRVYVQADEQFRSNPEDVGRFYVRSNDGKLVQLSTLVTLTPFTFPPIITRYNVYQAISIQAMPANGFSSGQAIQAMEEVANEVFQGGQLGVWYEWTGTALEEKSAGGASAVVFGMGFILVFLVLAAQYESYIDPLIIMLTVPLAILGALLGIWIRQNIFNVGTVWPTLSNDIFCQVGLVMLIGMASKNTILIVEFANQSLALGMSITKAAVYAAEKRLRPILMTAVSGLIGFLPLVTAEGAGAISRWSLGTAVFGGLFLATFLSLLIAPILYIVVKTLEKNFLSPKKPKGPGLPKKTAPPQLPEDEDEEVIQTLKTSQQEE